MTGKAGGSGPGPRDAIPSATPSIQPPGTVPSPAAPSGERMGPVQRVIRIINPLGLHFRVADRFSKLASQFVSAIRVINGELKADGKNIWDLISLLALQNTEVILEADGPDAPRAVDVLSSILAAPGGEDYTI